MALFQGLFFLVIGVGLLVVDYQSLSRGWLPCGPKGFEGRLEFRKSDQPGAFWAIFMLYLVSGLALTIFAIRLLAGVSTPLPLR